MAISLHPRHPADIRAQNKERIKNRPSILRNNTRLQLVVVLPAIMTAAAIYVALFFVNRVMERFVVDAGWGTDPSDEASGETYLRDVDGVVPEPKVIEQSPPPSPEWVVEEFRRKRAEAAAAAVAREAKPTLEPVLETEPLPLPTIELEPIALPMSSAGLPSSAVSESPIMEAPASSPNGEN